MRSLLSNSKQKNDSCLNEAFNATHPIMRVVEIEGDPLVGPTPDMNVASGTPIGPHACESSSGPIPCNISSSPEFVLGDSAVKKRRTKKKVKIDSPKRDRRISISSSQSGTQIPNSFLGNLNQEASIDLNKLGSGSRSGIGKDDAVNSSTQSMSSSSCDVGKTIEIGNQVGFVIEAENPAFMAAINGGGAKKGLH